MAEKILNTRIRLKYDSLQNWASNNPTLLEGELAIAYLPPKGDGTAPAASTEAVLFKVGPGAFNSLPWASALAADVYEWAKGASLPIDTTVAPEGKIVEGFKWEGNKLVPVFREFVTTIGEDTKNKLDAPTTKAVKEYVDSVAEGIVAQGTVVAEGAKIKVDQNQNTYTVKHEEIDAPTATAGTGRTYLTGVTTDGYGHITGFTTASEQDQDLEGKKDKQTAVANKITKPAHVLSSLTQNENGDISYEVKELTPANIGAPTIAEAQGYANAKDDAIAEAKKAGTDAADALNAYKGEMTTALAGKQDVIPENTYDAYGSAAQALADAKAYADQNDADTQYGIEYDSTNKKIKLVSDTSKTEIDASDFIKDGMIDTVTIDEDTQELVITWNTDAGKDATRIKLSELADIYTGVDGTTIKVDVSADDKISAEVKTESIKDGHIASDAAIAKSKLASDVQTSLGKADTALQEHQDISGKVDKVTGATNGNFAGLDANGNLTDSGKKAADFATAAQGALADTAVQPAALNDYVKKQEPITIEDQDGAARTEITNNNITLTQDGAGNLTSISNTGFIITTAAGDTSYFKVDLGDVDSASGETENVSVEMSADFKDRFNEALGIVTVNNGKLTVTGNEGLTGTGEFTANQAGDTTINVGIADKGVTTAKIADHAVGAAQLKAEQGYAGEDAEIWIFDCGNASTHKDA